MTSEEIVKVLEPQYIAVRILPDGSVAALGELIFTRAIHLGCDEHGWKKRFDFEDRELAIRKFLELKSKEDVPSGWVARRPESTETA